MKSDEVKVFKFRVIYLSFLGQHMEIRNFLLSN